jgi:actin-related protein
MEECLLFLNLIFPPLPPAGDLSCYNYMKKNPGTLCCLLVDSGYSFTHIVPYIKGKKLKQGIRRIDVGGKMLTNHLKEIISCRYSEIVLTHEGPTSRLTILVQFLRTCCYTRKEMCELIYV